MGTKDNRITSGKIGQCFLALYTFLRERFHNPRVMNNFT